LDVKLVAARNENALSGVAKKYRMLYIVSKGGDITDAME
jgi:hypothetical protein